MFSIRKMLYGALACVILTGPVKPFEYLGKIKKLEQGMLTLSLAENEQREVKIKLDARTRVLNIRGQEVDDEQIKAKILNEGSIVIIRIEANGINVARTIQPLGG